jgi:flagellar motor switch protein FliN/FliY
MNDTPLLTNSEIDIIGEVLNISMGAAATAISVILNRQVVITTPVVQAISKKDFEYKSLEPVIGVKINYVEGLNGANFMILNVSDAKAMVASLLGEQFSSDGSDDELDEMHASALGEIMNQMMGSASTALATFLQKAINISPPSIVEPDMFLNEFFSYDERDSIVAVSFKFFVQDLVDNEFITVFPVDFVKEVVSNVMGNIDTDISQSEDIPEVDINVDYDAVVTGHRPIPEFDMSEEDIVEKTEQKSKQDQPDKAKKPVDETSPRKNVSVRNLQLQRFDDDDNSEPETPLHESKNLDLLMDIGLNISVEIGSAKRTIKEVMGLTKGSIIELNKHADDPVDILVNGQLFARGDVVVIDDNFGVRITEVVHNRKK